MFYILPFNFSPSEDCLCDSKNSGTIAFTNVTVIPMTGPDVILKNQTVTINGGIISAVRPTSQNDLNEGAFDLVIDGTGKYLMPGLAEMHGHIPPTHPSPSAPSYFNAEYVENTLFLYIAAGVTTVRGMLGYENQLELKDKMGVAGNWELVGPRLFLAGPSFNGNSVSSPEQASKKVIEQKEEGWDLLKVHPGLSLPEYQAMAKTANEISIPFGGHVPADVGIENAIALGQQTMDHIDGYVAYLEAFEGAEQEQRMAEIIQQTLDYNVWIVPTQALWETIIGAADYDAMKQYDELKYIPKPVLNGYNNWVTNNIDNNESLNLEDALDDAVLRQRLLFEMNKAGVNILMGTDAPQLYSVPGFSIHRELSKMAESGMSNYDILKSGTTNVGSYLKTLGVSSNYGIITLNSISDLILVDDSPLEDLSNLKKLSGVLVHGRWYSKEMIDKKLAKIEASYR
ncbi:MAG: amidohydrolase family protein [Balneolaceae bacterium]